MIALTEDMAAELRALVRAGEAGLLLGGPICASTAMFLALHGLATITNGRQPPQRAVATDQARAFMLRGVS